MRFDHKSHLLSLVARRSDALKDSPKDLEILQKAHQLIKDRWQRQTDQQLVKALLDSRELNQRSL